MVALQTLFNLVLGIAIPLSIPFVYTAIDFLRKYKIEHKFVIAISALVDNIPDECKQALFDVDKESADKVFDYIKKIRAKQHDKP